jgi:chemotaxis protein CheD
LMLPDSSINPRKAASEPHMFVDTGVPRLFRAVYSLGGERARIVIKVAGGGRFFDTDHAFNIGQRNLAALHTLLAGHGYAPHAIDVGGTSSRTLRLEIATGYVTISSPGTSPYRL